MAEKLTIVFADALTAFGPDDRIVFTNEFADSVVVTETINDTIVFTNEFSDSMTIADVVEDTQLAIQAGPRDVILVPSNDEEISIVISHLPGERGPAGPPGSAAGTSQYVLTAVTSRVFTHNLPYPPGVRLIDSANRRVFADVEYLSETQIYVSFPSPFTGRAILF